MITVAFSKYKRNQTRNVSPVPSYTKKALSGDKQDQVETLFSTHGIHRARDRLSENAASPLCLSAA